MMANWDCHYWLSDLKLQYGSLLQWEKRAFIVSSYLLGDEGRHWRRSLKNTLNKMELLIKDWASDRFQKKTDIPI